MTDIHPVALFRLSVLGPLASRERLERGELERLIEELAERSYAIPGAKRTRVSEQTIESWYYAWRRGGIEALAPKPRCDQGCSKLSGELQAACLQAKRENPRRSPNRLLHLLERAGIAAQGELSRSSLHRLLQRHGLSRVTGCPSAPVERRSLVAARAGDIWYGDVMHGPTVAVKGRVQKVYLASLMDDASRLIAHSALAPRGDGARHRGGARAGGPEKGFAQPARDRQRGGLSGREPAGHLRPSGDPAHLLPPLCPGGQGEARALAPHGTR